MQRLADHKGSARRWAWIGVGSALIVLAAAAAGWLVSLTSASAATSTQTFPATADARVASDQPNTNYGASTTLKADASPTVRSYLRFNVQGLSGTVSRATLRLFATSASSKGYSVRSVTSTTWGEMTITYANAPAMSATATAPTGAYGSGTWTTTDITSLIAGNGAYSVAITTASTTALALASRESGANAPQLVIETTTQDPLPASPPANTAQPTVSGTPQAGQTLTADPGTWSGTPPIAYAYQWRRCDGAGAGCQDVPGATGQTYPLAAGDVGSTIRVVVTASNAAGSATATSGFVGPVTSPPPLPSLPLPIRAAFYYPWFPGSWTQGGVFPFTKYTPSLGYYDSSSTSLIQSHVASMQYAKIQAGISSWWGQGSTTDARVPTLLAASAGSGFPWGIYHEGEASGDPTASQITSDLTYLRDRYASDPSYLRIGGKFVVFVYSGPGDTCGMVDRWKQGNTVGAFVVLKVFTGYRSCANQPDGWHQYSPVVAADTQGGYSFAISPGFFKANESAPRLVRDPVRWRQNVRDMVASNAPFQLVTTFNEWGEGTAVESASEWASPSGHGDYLDALHDDGAEPAASPPASTSPPTISGTPAAGQTLTASPGGWSGTAPISHAYQWRRCDALGGGCVDVAGATGQTYLLSSPDVGSTIRVAVTASNAVGAATASSGYVGPVTAGGSPGAVVVGAAGDIADLSFGADKTASVLDAMNPDVVLALGDNAYPNGSASDFQTYYEPTWGRHKGRTRPVAGNHEYVTPGASGHFGYFGSAAGDPAKGYYSFDLGGWHLIALNSNCSAVGGCGPGSAQYQWLAADLQATQATCIAAYWHHPRFSGGSYADNANFQPFWQLLYDRGADLVLNGHDHNYQRYAPLTPDGLRDDVRGIRELVVGTGGKGMNALVQPGPATRQAGNDTALGVIKLTLRSGSYDWEFVPVAGKTYTDAGTSSCDRTATDTTPPSAPSSLVATATGPTQVSLGWQASTDDTGIRGYEVFRDGASIASMGPVTSYMDATVAPSTSYSYTVRATDTSGNPSPPSEPATVTTPGASILTFAPTDDSFVALDAPTASNGSSAKLEVDNSPVKHILLRFNVTGVGAGRVTSAKLRLHAVDPSGVGGQFYRTASSSWSEQTVTWNTAPAADPSPVASLGTVAAGSWYEVDLTSLVTGDGPLSLRITSTSSNGADYASKEGAAGLAPSLVVTAQ